MARRRYVSTTISQDTRVNKLAVQYGDFAALLYTWMIPHAADDATLPGDPEELLYQVLPGRRDKSPEDVQAALDGMTALGLIQPTGDGRITFPPVAFYKYQPYIKKRNPGIDQDHAPEVAQPEPPSEPCADAGANQRNSAQNSASLRLTSSSSFSSSVRDVDTPPTPMPIRPPVAPPLGGVSARRVPKPTTLNDDQQGRFERWYSKYPNKQHRPDAEKAFAKLDPDDALTEQLIADVQERRTGRKWSEGFVEYPATYLNQRIWEDDIERTTPLRRVSQADINSGRNGKFVP